MDWFYSNGGQKFGPINQAEFDRLVGAGVIQPDTLIWRNGMPEWQEFGTTGGAGPSPMSASTSGSPSATGTRVCAECGGSFHEGEMVRYQDAWVCTECKPAFFQKLKEGIPVGQTLNYAGFWIRFGAKLIDGIVLYVVNRIVTSIVGAALIHTPTGPPDAGMFAGFGVLYFISIAIGAGYTTFFIGKYGATLGKMACRLRVVTAEGGKVSYLRALGRHFAEMLSAFTLMIGYIMAAFDDEKRALHDRICNTRVIRIN